MHRNKLHPWRIAITIALLASGCDRRDERLTQLAQSNAELQARQNQEMAELNREVASGTRRLVEANAASSERLLAMQNDLQRQHEQIEAERRSLARERARESLFVPILSSLGAILLALLPLTICWQLLAQIQDEPPEVELSSLLLEQVLESGASRQALPTPTHRPTSLLSPSSSEGTSSEPLR